MLYLKNVTYHPPATPQAIIENINLTLAPQKLGLIVGTSGSGKTTLLEILAGLAEKTSGEILWDTDELTPEELQQLSGIVFQFPERHFCGNNVLEELRLGHPELSAIRVKEALTEVGLEHISYDTPPHALSGGQQRRLSLAVQLIRQPNILLLDEPTAGLDWLMKDQLVNLLSRLKQHWTLLVVTHDASDLVEIADNCWRIDNGRIESVNPDIFNVKKKPKIAFNKWEKVI
ncbi:energy-coupling factor ABC transporter ATP-binding protein [Geminocystis sp. GBBB08]|uniref:ABC transporter ATP-binding protein n=1 Tax=Geminocystis sp. GBBB08 TaxID=2604140 RepID=UPI0027E33808|nr:energy-coupling factor ABC transporter ATP-binding protein [Geminocystis sp. GBBB08]MBL1209879.1 energy-coupling factor ABC transporter ATP-binding protein [Geminocystis sp. GBBB08]